MPQAIKKENSVEYFHFKGNLVTLNEWANYMPRPIFDIIFLKLSIIDGRVLLKTDKSASGYISDGFGNSKIIEEIQIPVSKNDYIVVADRR